MKNILSQQEKDKIDEICAKYDINYYHINPDGSIDVNGSVYLSDKELTRIPLQFNKVSEFFYCDTNKLTSLKGCPNEVGASFSCSNNKLKSLKYGPEKVDLVYYCRDNILTSLEYAPKTVNDFYCDNNKLTSLIGSPIIVKGLFNCPYNELLTTLEGCPDKVGMINCDHCSLSSLDYLPSKMEDGILLDDNNFPNSFTEMYDKLNNQQCIIFSKYISYYDIWVDGVYQEENMKTFYNDLIDGLQ